MPHFPRGTLGSRLLLACLALAGSHADALPPLRIDPALLGGSNRSGTRPPSAPATSTITAPAPAVAAAPTKPTAPAPAPAVGTLPIGKDGDEPTFISADSIQGINDREVVAVGSVELTKGEMRMRADRLTYWQQDEELEATGNIRFTQRGDKLSGPYLKIKTEAKTGVFEQPVYQISQAKIGPGKSNERDPGERQTTGFGKANRLEFEGDGQYRFKDVTYSTCQPVEGREQDWFVRIADLQLDYNDEVGNGKDTTLVFKGVPILYWPSLSFSLNNKRKSGLLAPTLGSTSKSGLEYAQPIYWNIAPDMDATFSPRLMSKRGVQLNGELRYLGAAYNGQTRVEYLPNDRVLGTRRSGYSVIHNHHLGGGLSGQLNLNGVSDDTYFSDLSTKVSTVSQSNLLRQGNLFYHGGWWQANLLAQSYQTLQDPALPPLGIPYQRLPQLTFNALRPDLPLGLQFNLQAERVTFRHATLTEGDRFTVYPQLSLPWQTAAFYVTPKIGVHATRYSLDRITTAGTPAQQSRSLPIFSIDAGAFLERDMNWFGRKLNQTLEPRLYYLNIPKREQQSIPVFDTAIADFNFAQIFAENRYVGGDRIADANQLTAVVTSRLIDPATGAELLRGAFGQRLYFTTQHVGLPGETLRTDRQTDFLAALTGQILPRTHADFALQYNPRDRRTERFNLGARYQPEAGKVINAGYRYTRDILGALQPGVGQVDVSGQWPLTGNWHAVGRYNYSTKDHRVVETLGGLEYNGGCWIARVVVQRLATQAQNSNTAMFLQLELNDFSRIGSNPLELLKRNIPGYGNINQPNVDPAFISN